MDTPRQCIKCLGTQHWDYAYNRLVEDEHLTSICVAAEYKYRDDCTVVEWEWILYKNNGCIMKRVIRNGNIIEDGPY